MKLRWKILITLGIFFALIFASLTVTLRVQPEGELEAYKKILRAQGEKLELNRALPPPLASEDNSAPFVNEAFRLLGSADARIVQGMTMVAPGKALVGWSQPDARGPDFTNSWEDFASWIDGNRPAMEQVQQILSRPKLDFQLDYTKGAAMMLPNLAPMKRATQVLHSAAVFNLHLGDTGAAVTNILVSLALISRDVRDNLIISHLVHIAMAAIAVNPTWELLQTTNVTDAQLAAVQRSWEGLDYLSDTEQAFIMERISMNISIRETRASHQKFKEMFDSSGFGSSSGGSSWADMLTDATASPRAGAAEAMWRSSWSYTAELEVLKANQIMIDALRTMQTNRDGNFKTNYDDMTTRLTSLTHTNLGQSFFRALKIPDFTDMLGDKNMGGVVRRTLLAETARRIVVTAIALKRFQLAQGKPPQTLNELAPQFLSAVPIDPMDGKPLKYHPGADGTFLLYSVGENGTDEGGDATGSTRFNWQDRRNHDWVWPQPATPEEIQNFYEHPPSP